MFTIRKAELSDAESVLELYKAAQEFMKESGNLTQWQNGYPSRQTFEADIESGAGYVCQDEGGQIVGTFAYFFGRDIDPNYASLRGGKWLDQEPYGVIHRIATKRGTHGAGKFCLDWAFEKSRRLRIDTHRDNAPMQNLLKKCGFVFCGTITLVDGDGSERDAFMRV